MAKNPKTRSPIKDRATREAVWRYLKRLEQEAWHDQFAASGDAASGYRYSAAVGREASIHRITAKGLRVLAELEEGE